MIVGVTQYGPETYAITFGDAFSTILRVGQTMDGGDFSISVVEFMGIHGVEVKNKSGLYTKDINGSGALKLIRVEDEEGNMLND